MAKRQRKYQWYLEPIGGAANEQIAAELARVCDGGAFALVKCADGKPHNLLPCSKELCTTFAASWRLGKQINVFRKEGQYGTPQNVNSLFESLQGLPTSRTQKATA